MRLRLVVAGLVSSLVLSFVPVALRAADTESPAFFPAGPREAALPALADLLGFAPGSRSATSTEIGRCLEHWAASSPRARLVEHGRSWEGRPLRHLIVSSPANLARLDEIRDGWARIADARRSSAAEAERLANELPAVAWLAFSIHGDEVSPADAAMVLADHLVASRSPEVESLLERLVVILDPMQNPDGRDRFLARVAETTGRVPVSDGQSVQQDGSWPWGRTNHYHFDLNRDWVFATQPETRARLAALRAWHPLFFLDVHEMGLDSPTFLFYPPRAPFNPFLPAPARKWWDRFGLDEAAAFDRQGWRYYTGEWADWWYPGYSDSFGTFRGAIGILHEQGGITAGSVRLDNGQLLTYRESVAHQVTAAWANLETLAEHREAIGHDFAASRRRGLAADGPLAGRTLAIVPDGNRARFERFAATVELLGGELTTLDQATRVDGRDALGRERSTTLPAGTLLVASRQPEGALLRATLDFDLPLPAEVLAKERAALLSDSDTELYDITGWSLPLLYGLDAWELDLELAAGQTTPITAAELARAGAVAVAPAGERPAVAWVIDGADDRSVAAAVRLLGLELQVRLADVPFELDGVRFARGSLVVNLDDNRARAATLAADVERAAAETGLALRPVSTGFAERELPDLGGRHFLRLERPRVALVGHGYASTTQYGALWHTLDRELGLATSLLPAHGFADLDLRRYNVLVLAPGVEVDEAAGKVLRGWVESGGTLVATGSAAAALAEEKAGVSTVRELEDVLGQLAAHRADFAGQWADRIAASERQASLASAVDGHVVGLPSPPPWEGIEPEGSAAKDVEEMARREKWAKRFLPEGVILAGRADIEHWLTVGARAELPLFVDDGPILMIKAPAEAPVRLGVLEAGRESTGAARRWRNYGWSALPEGSELRLRLSGLLWPEAAERLANAPYLVREPIGQGQLILFAGDPVYRGSALGSARLLANAVVYGPGCGTTPPLLP